MTEDLGDWVKRELVVDPEKDLLEQRERVKRFIGITKEGIIIVRASGLPARLSVGLYYLGASYAKVAKLRETDCASGKELVEKLHLPVGTVYPKIKELLKEQVILGCGQGKYRFNNQKASEFLSLVEHTAGGSGEE